MGKYESLKILSPKHFRRLTGIKRETFENVKKRNNKQKYFYSGKKKRHTLKSQVVVDKKTHFELNAETESREDAEKQAISH